MRQDAAVFCVTAVGWYIVFVLVFVFIVTSIRNTNTLRKLSAELLMFKRLVHIVTTALKNINKSKANISESTDGVWQNCWLIWSETQRDQTQQSHNISIQFMLRRTDGQAHSMFWARPMHTGRIEFTRMTLTLGEAWICKWRSVAVFALIYSRWCDWRPTVAVRSTCVSLTSTLQTLYGSKLKCRPLTRLQAQTWSSARAAHSL
jgi:hypothetical protein